jgi:hypothetical protein
VEREGAYLVDVASGFPHDLTCPRSEQFALRRISAVVRYCWPCGRTASHERVANPRVALEVCLQCGQGSVKGSDRLVRGVEVPLEG